jgi:hypothetical protein
VPSAVILTLISQLVAQLKTDSRTTLDKWHLMPDGTIIVRAKTKSILDLAGKLKAPKGKKVRIEEMNAWR